MARSRRKKVALFYEALAATPRLPRVSLSAPKLPRLMTPSDAQAGATTNADTSTAATPSAAAVMTAAAEQLRQLPWRQWASEFAADTVATVHDGWMYGRRGWQLAADTMPHWRRIGLVAMAGLVAVTVTAGTVMGVQTVHKYGADISNPAIIMNQKDVGTTITDRNGVVLFQGYGAENRQSVPLSQVPATVKQATLAAEDPNFYHEPGFSIRGTTRAAYEDLTHSSDLQGGSTIAQQLVKNTLLNNEKSFTRKYQEVVLAVDLEHHYSKDQILQMYLNTIYYGEGAYGIESAAQTYFHEPASQLTLEQSALLAGLPQSPSVYDPNVDPAAAKARRDYVLSRMQQFGYASPAAVQHATAQAIATDSRNIEIKAPHFVFYVLGQLEQQYGENMVEHGGITVRTTLDYTKQEAAETIVTNQVNKLASHHVTNGGLISLDPRNGDIVSMVGSVNYNQPGWGAVNTTLAQLQPGSSFKPIAYAEAFLKGWNGATVVNDGPMCWPLAGQAPYCPQDYDQKWRGPVLLRRALSNSLNIPALQVLEHAGITDTIALGHAMGLQSPSLEGDPNQYGLPLVLGAGDVRPIDMAAVYGTIDEGGKTVVPRAILSVQDKYGKDITKPQPGGGQPVLDPRVAYMVTNILSDNKARQEEFGVKNPLQLDRPAAAKTGTTNDFDDNWTDGYTPSLVTVVWVGNNDHTPMENVDGITGAAPIWHDYMEMASAGTPVQQFAVPPGVVFAKVCPSDGGLDTNPSDPNAINEVFLAGTVPTKPCGAYSIGNPYSAPVTTPALPAQPVPLAQSPTAPTPSPQTPQQPGIGGGGTGSGGTNPGNNPGIKPGSSSPPT